MRYLRNQDGVALLTALMFTLLTLGMIMMLLYYVAAGTRMSAGQKRYRNTVEASYGGTEFVTKTLIPRLLVFNGYSSQKVAMGGEFATTLELAFVPKTGTLDPLKEKLFNPTSAWPSGVSRTVDPKVAPDMTFVLKGPGSTGDFKVYSKIVDTIPGVGVIDESGIDYLDGGLGVAGTSTTTATLRTPNIYSIEVQGERAAGSKEKAALSVLYAY